MRALAILLPVILAAGCKSEHGACVEPGQESWCLEDVTTQYCSEEGLKVDSTCADEGFAIECAEHPTFGYMMWAVDQATCDGYTGGDTDPA